MADVLEPRVSRSESISSAASSSIMADSPVTNDMNGRGAAVQRGRRSGTNVHDDDRGDEQEVDDDDDGGGKGEGMSDEVMAAIAALGIMKRGGSSTGASSAGVPTTTMRNGHGQQQQQQQLPQRRTAHSTSRSGSLTSHDSLAWSASGVSESTAASSPCVPGSAAATDSEMGDDELLPTVAQPGPPATAAASQHADPNFISRVSQLPVISGGLEWYGQAKANSRVVKYGAGLVESSFNAVSRPIANNLQLGQLDDFACRQLDRFGPTSSPASSAATLANAPISSSSMEPPATSMNGSKRKNSSKKRAASTTEPPRDELRGSSWTTRAESVDQDQMNGQQAVVVAGGRSRWQTVLVEAGGIGAAVSEESLKSLRYCLQWLLYATAHLDHQIAALREFIVSLQRHSRDGGNGSSDALVTASASAHLSQIKHDVVETIRKVVDVVSKYAGVALPEQARRYVRQSILGLPVKWASAIDGRRDSRASSVAAASDVSTPRPERMEDPNAPTSADHNASEASASNLGPTEDAAERVLTFAVESLDMLRSVTGIFGESIQRAEDWIERLRIVGLDRQRQRRDDGDESMADEQVAGTKRRRAIAGDSEQGLATGIDAGTNAAQDEGVTRRKRGPRSRESSAAH